MLRVTPSPRVFNVSEFISHADSEHQRPIAHIPRDSVVFEYEGVRSELYIAAVALQVLNPLPQQAFQSDVPHWYVGFSTAGQLLAACQRLLRERLFSDCFRRERSSSLSSLLWSASPPVQIRQISVGLVGDSQDEGVATDTRRGAMVPLEDAFATYTHERVSLAAVGGQAVARPPYLASVTIFLRLNTTESQDCYIRLTRAKAQTGP